MCNTDGRYVINIYMDVHTNICLNFIAFIHMQRMQDECEAMIEAHGGSSLMSSKSGKSTKSSKSTKGYKPTTSQPTGQPTSAPTLPPVPPTPPPTGVPTSSPTSQPTNAPTSQPTGVPTTQPTSAPTPCGTCIKIVTGVGSFYEGFIDVFVDSGLGYVEVTGPGDEKYEKGVTVLDACYDNFNGIEVTSNNTNAWVGSITASVDCGVNYDVMQCTGCNGTTTDTSIMVVDGDGNGGSIGPTTLCLDGRTGYPNNACTIVLDDSVS